MLKLSRTNVLTSLAALGGLLAAAGFVLSGPELGGAALSVTAVLVAGLVHSVGRDVRAVVGSAPGAGRALAKRIDEGTAKVELLLRQQQKSAREAAAHADHMDAMVRRVVADIGAARLEDAERANAGEG